MGLIIFGCGFMEEEDWARIIQNRYFAQNYQFFVSFFDCTFLSDLIHIFWGLEEENMISQVSLITNDVYFN